MATKLLNVVGYTVFAAVATAAFAVALYLPASLLVHAITYTPPAKPVFTGPTWGEVFRGR